MNVLPPRQPGGISKTTASDDDLGGSFNFLRVQPVFVDFDRFITIFDRFSKKNPQILNYFSTRFHDF
jgi:hypothetical protein